jgi:N-acetylneuraminic acid mutarotase
VKKYKSTILASFFLLLIHLPVFSDSWTTLASLNSPQRATASVGTLNGKIYAIGGRGYGVPMLSTEEYDTLINAWTYQTDMYYAPVAANGAILGDKLYIAGGCDGYTVYPHLQVYDPTTDTWCGKRPMPSARWQHRVASALGKLYVIGGKGEAGELGSVEEYDPVTDTWSSKTPMPTPRHMFGITVYNDHIYAIGGNTSYAGTQLTGKVEVYDPLSNSWDTAATMPTPRSTLAAATIGGKIYAMGGDPSGTVEVYDPAGNSWAMGSSMPQPLQNHGTVELGGSIYTIGGSYYNGSDCNLVYRYNPLTGVETEMPTAPSPSVLAMEIHPNPFRQTTDIACCLPQDTKIGIHVYNKIGQCVAKVFEGQGTPGMHKYHWDSTNLPSGQYFIRLDANGQAFTRKIIKIKS